MRPSLTGRTTALNRFVGCRHGPVSTTDVTTPFERDRVADDRGLGAQAGAHAAEFTGIRHAEAHHVRHGAITLPRPVNWVCNKDDYVCNYQFGR